MFDKKPLILALVLIAIFMIVMVLVSNFEKTEVETSPPKTSKKPIKNIILIIADDLGWSDVGYASGPVLTPTIDQMATNGIILNQTYTYSMCTPSRSAILTGVFSERTGMQHFVIPDGLLGTQPVGIPLNFDLIPKYLKPYGFKSHIVGKWHVGSCKMEYTPVYRGFDSFYGFFYDRQDYYTHKSSYLNETYDDFWYQTNDFLRPVADEAANIYSTYAFNDRITKIIDSHDKNKPLFLIYSAQNSHSAFLFQAPSEFKNKFSHVENDKRRTILGMINLLDESILNITRDLERNNMLDNTLIFFTSDNGGAITDMERNYPLRGGKTTVFEGGTRVRAFIYGKDTNIEPYVYNGMFHSVDWLPTIVSAALDSTIEIDGIDGVNQWDSIINDAPSKRDSFIYTINPLGNRRNFNLHCNTSTEAIRVGDWKLIRGCPGLLTDWYNLTDFNPDVSLDRLDLGIELSISYLNDFSCLNFHNKTTHRYFLFNIKEDPTEKNNLAAQMPCKVRELEKRLEEYQRITVTPQLKEPLVPNNDPRADPRNSDNKFWPGWC